MLDVCRWSHRYRSPARSSSAGAMGQLAKGHTHRTLSAALRGTDLSQESLSQTRANEACGIPAKGNQAPSSSHARTRHLEKAGTINPGLPCLNSRVLSVRGRKWADCVLL